MTAYGMVLSMRPSVDVPTPKEATRGAILQHLQPAAQALPTHRISSAGQGPPGRAPCPGLHLLGPVRGDAVLPARPSALAAGNLRRVGQLRGQADPSGDHGTGPGHTGLRQRASPVAALSGGVRGTAGALRGGRARPPAVPFQEQARQCGLHGDRAVCQGLRLGEVSPHEGCGQTASAPRSRWLPAAGRGDHRRQAPTSAWPARCASRRAPSW